MKTNGAGNETDENGIADGGVAEGFAVGLPDGNLGAGPAIFLVLSTHSGFAGSAAVGFIILMSIRKLRKSNFAGNFNEAPSEFADSLAEKVEQPRKETASFAGDGIEGVLFIKDGESDGGGGLAEVDEKASVRQNQ